MRNVSYTIGDWEGTLDQFGMDQLVTNMRPGNLMPKLQVQGTGDVCHLGMEREYGSS